MKFYHAFFLVLFVFKVLAVGVVAGWSWWVITFPLWLPFVLEFANTGLAALNKKMDGISRKYK